jgi:hypothetical protein
MADGIILTDGASERRSQTEQNKTFGFVVQLENHGEGGIE